MPFSAIAPQETVRKTLGEESLVGNIMTIEDPVNVMVNEKNSADFKPMV